MSSVLLQMLSLVPREIHEVHQQERLHHVRHQEHKLLQISQVRLQLDHEEPREGCRVGQRCRLPALPREARHCPHHWLSVLPGICWTPA